MEEVIESWSSLASIRTVAGGTWEMGVKGGSHIYTVCSVLGAAISIYLLNSPKRSLSYIFKSSLLYK